MSTRVLPATPAAIAEAAELLGRGDVVGVPTETVYGLAAALAREDGLAQVFEVKARPRFDPLIVHVVRGPGAGAGEALIEAGLVDRERLRPAARGVLEAAAARFWPGPLTLVLPRGPAVPDLATAGLDTVALRMPAHPVAQALLRALGGPFAAPSANRFGRVSPTEAAHVRTELEGRVPLVLDGGACAVGLESTVVRVEPDGALSLLRPGAIGAAAIGALGPLREASPHLDGQAAEAPGRLASHYAPAATVRVFEAGPTPAETSSRVSALAPPHGAVVLLLGPDPRLEAALRAALGPTVELAILGGTPEARARSLFRTLRALDARRVPAIVAELPSPASEGLDHAIRDRLTRAATRGDSTA